MQLKTLFACASFVAAAVAQISQQRIAFTTLPTSVQAGQPTTLKWGGGNGAPVTITLQKGTTTNLQTVSVLTGDATGNSYTWTPSSSLPDGQDYALKIEQGDQEPNYTGMITLTGGSSSSASLTSAVSSASSLSTASVVASTSAAVAAPSSAIPVNSANSTTTTPIVAANATTAAPTGTGVVGTGVGASGSAATGTSIHRNTTMSKATLTSSAAASSSAAATTSSGSETSGGAAPSSTKGSGAIMSAASNFALVCAAVVGVIYLG